MRSPVVLTVLGSLALLVSLGGRVARADDDDDGPPGKPADKKADDGKAAGDKGGKPGDKKGAEATKPGAATKPGRPKEVVERVVAVVNDTIILESELVQRAAPDLEELDKIPDPRERARQAKQVMRETLDHMIDEELVLEAAEESKIEITDDDVDKAIENIKQQNKMDDEKFQKILAQQGYTIGTYRKDVKKQIVRLRAINMLVRPRVSVTDDEVREYYDKMIGRSAAVTEVHVRHILIKLPEHPSREEVADARRRAGDLVARAKGGEDFGKLAKENSEDPNTKDKGGDLGSFKRGTLATEWEEILFGMQPGEVRGPVQGPTGLHVFQVVSNKKDDVKPFAEVKEPLRQQLTSEELEKQTKVWLEELHKKAHIEVKL